MIERKVEEIQIAGQAFRVRELTVAEVRAWIEASKNKPTDGYGDGLFEDIGLWDLAQLLGVEVSVFEGMTPSDISKVKDKVREANPDFFGWVVRVNARLAKLESQALTKSSVGS